MLIVDSVAPFRQQSAPAPVPGSGASLSREVDVPVPAARNDQVAEAALGKVVPYPIQTVGNLP